MRCIAGNKIFEECESERACNGTLDVLPHHNTLMKAQALCVNVPENCDEYKRSLGDLVCHCEPRSQRQMVIRMNPFTMELSGCTTDVCNGEQSRISVCCLQLVSYLPVVCLSLPLH